MMLVGLDSSVLVYLLPVGTPEGQQDRQREARELYALADRQYRFTVATPTIAEVLVHVPEPLRRAVAGELERMFSVHAFDMDSAVIAARLWPGRPRVSGQNGRQVVKVDLQIAATALRWDVKGFCTFEDQQAERLRAVAPGLQIGPPLLFLPEQKPLPFKG